MSRTRTRIAAAQAALSVVLLLVVYLTLLRSDSADDMPPVEARQGQEFNFDGVFPPRGERDGAAQGEGNEAAGPNAGDLAANGGDLAGASAPEGLGAARAGGSTGSPEQNTTDPPSGDGEEDSPTDDQYADAVSRLLKRVGAPD